MCAGVDYNAADDRESEMAFDDGDERPRSWRDGLVIDYDRDPKDAASDKKFEKQRSLCIAFCLVLGLC